MLIYLKNSENKFVKNLTSVEEYRGVDLEGIKLGSIMHGEPFPESVHSWFIDELQEEIVELVRAGDLDGVKGKISELSKEPEYLASVRFCSDGYSTQKYNNTAGGPFDGYSLLNLAIFCGHEDLTKYLINECGMNPNDKCYANSIWTAGLPTNVAVTEYGVKGFSTLQQSFKILKNLVDGEDVLRPVQLEGHRSGKVNDTVFHIVARVKDNDLRGEMLSFFAARVPVDAVKKSNFGVSVDSSEEEKEAKGSTPIAMLCTKHSFDKLLQKVVDVKDVDIFERDLGILRNCGGFEEYNLTPEYNSLMRDLPSEFTRVFARSFNPSNNPSAAALSANKLINNASVSK